MPQTKKVFENFPRGSGVFQQDFKGTKIGAVLEPSQFSRTWSFEAKANNLIFEANAKDFKMCPRDQGRPRGLHLWSISTQIKINIINNPSPSAIVIENYVW